MEEFIKKALTDEKAMSELLDQLEPMVFRIAYHLTRHQQDAEDLAQEVLYKICTKLHQYRSEGSIQTWIYTMVMNAHRDQLRKMKHQRHQVPLQDEEAQTGNLEQMVSSKVFLDQVFANLPDVDRNIFILRFQNDLSVREVATIMNMSESNVKTRVFRLRNQLRQIFRLGGEAL